MALYNELVLLKIASFLGFDDLKSCRAINSFWKDITTSVLRKRGICSLQLDETSISSIVNSDPVGEFLWDSVDLAWGFGHSHSEHESTHYDFGQFFFKFGHNIKQLKWTGADLSKEHDEVLDNSYKFSLNGIRKRIKFDSSMGEQLGEYLYLMPNLESLTIGKMETPCAPFIVKLCTCNSVSDSLNHLSKLRVTNLTTLNLSTHAFLNVRDMSLLNNLGLKMKNFTWLGRAIRWKNGIPMGDLINSWSSTLEKLHFRISPDFTLGPMPVLKSFRVEVPFKLMNPLPFVEQFPALEEMNWNVEPSFKWDLFLPAEMPSHFHLHKLNLQNSHSNTIPIPFYVRLLEKCPNLKSLTTSTIFDEVATAIFKNLLDLEYLETSPGFTCMTFTGVDDPYDDEASARDVLNPNILSIRKLTKLKELKINGNTDDTCVWFGIALLDNLEKLWLPLGISDMSLDRLQTQAPKLRELILTVPAIDDGENWLSDEALDSLEAARPELKIKYVVYPVRCL